MHEVGSHFQFLKRSSGLWMKHQLARWRCCSRHSSWFFMRSVSKTMLQFTMAAWQRTLENSITLSALLHVSLTKLQQRTFRAGCLQISAPDNGCPLWSHVRHLDPIPQPSLDSQKSMYWSKTFRIPAIAEKFPRDRFFRLGHNLSY